MNSEQSTSYKWGMPCPYGQAMSGQAHAPVNAPTQETRVQETEQRIPDLGNQTQPPQRPEHPAMPDYIRRPWDTPSSPGPARHNLDATTTASGGALQGGLRSPELDLQESADATDREITSTAVNTETDTNESFRTAPEDHNRQPGSPVYVPESPNWENWDLPITPSNRANDQRASLASNVDQLDSDDEIGAVRVPKLGSELSDPFVDAPSGGEKAPGVWNGMVSRLSALKRSMRFNGTLKYVAPRSPLGRGRSAPRSNRRESGSSRPASVNSAPRWEHVPSKPPTSAGSPSSARRRHSQQSQSCGSGNAGASRLLSPPPPPAEYKVQPRILVGGDCTINVNTADEVRQITQDLPVIHIKGNLCVNVAPGWGEQDNGGWDDNGNSHWEEGEWGAEYHGYNEEDVPYDVW